MDAKIIQHIKALKSRYDTKYADFFDLDGTVIDGNILTNSVRSIVYATAGFDINGMRDLIDSIRFSVQPQPDDPVKLYDDSRITTKEAIHLVESGLFYGWTEDKIRELIYSEMEQIMASCYSLPRAIILALRQRVPRRLIICITGTPQEIAEIICPYLGFDAVIGCRYPKENGVYIPGQSNLDAGLKKGVVIERLKEECGISCHESIAAGNTKYDYEMFKLSAYPIAINPKGSLQTKIRQTSDKKWNNKKIAWIDQKHGEPIEEHMVWLPDEKGMLYETELETVLPSGLAEMVAKIAKIKAQKWFSP